MSTPILLGVDIGTSKISAVAVEATSGRVAAAKSSPNQAACRKSEPWRFEQDPMLIFEQTVGLLKELVTHIPGDDVAGVGFAGQMHGLLLTDASAACPLTPLITWQDTRCALPLGKGNYIDRVLQLVGEEVFHNCGCQPAVGLGGMTLFWLKQNGQLPPRVLAMTIQDFLAARVCACAPVMDASNAASFGVFDLVNGIWHARILNELGLAEAIFPPVRLNGGCLGRLAPQYAGAIGLPAGLPVAVAMGDNQAAFLGTARERFETILLNLGTGGQLCVPAPHFCRRDEMDTRPLPGGGFLLVYASLYGGRAYAQLESFFRQAGGDLFNISGADPLFDYMNRLATKVPAGSEGLICQPFFAGTRNDPYRRGALRGLNEENFTPGHLCRAVLEGIVEELYGRYHSGADVLIKNHQLAGAGNALRRNPVLRHIAERRFGQRLHLAVHQEEAAYGAALAGGVAAGVFPDFAEASRRIVYLGDEATTGR